ncbi:unnamed protein product [Closterium sp. NIES-53]
MSIRVASPNIEPHSIFLLTFVHLTAPTHVLHFYSSKSGLSPPVPRGSPPKSVKARNLSFALLTWVPHVLLTSAPLLPTFAVARCCCMLLPPVRFTLPPVQTPLVTVPIFIQITPTIPCPSQQFLSAADSCKAYLVKVSAAGVKPVELKAADGADEASVVAPDVISLRVVQVHGVDDVILPKTLGKGDDDSLKPRKCTAWAA